MQIKKQIRKLCDAGENASDIAFTTIKTIVKIITIFYFSSHNYRQPLLNSFYKQQIASKRKSKF